MGFFQLIHIISSVMTLAVMLLASILAMSLLYQDHLLRFGKTTQFTHSNIESSEKRLFQVIFFGFLLLTLIILSSFYFFFELRFSFFLKLSLSLLAWVIFAGLLFWRHYYGLRGRLAVMATLVGVGLLLCVYLWSLFFLG